MARGYYTRSVIVAWDFNQGQLTRRWTFDSDDGTPGNTAYRGQGAHSLSISDVDADGRDEIVYGAATIDDNGRGLHSTRLGHGDALHVSDMNPSRPGQEVFMPHEGTGGNGHVGASLRDGATGEVLVSLPVTQNSDGSWPDVGRGVAMDIDPRSPGYEFWTSYHPNTYGVKGNVVATRKPSSTNFGVWWDADPLRELLNATMIDKWNPATNSSNRVLTAYQAAPISSINGTKSNPSLSADLFGDWREEVVWRASNNTSLYVFTTTIPTAIRLPTLMHDTQYRTAVAWQNVAYNQPPHPSFFLGDGMATPPAPNIRYAGDDTAPPPPSAGPVYPAEHALWGGGTTIDSNNGGFNGTGFANFSANGGFLQFAGVNGGASGGATTLTFRYANGAAGARTGALTINGVTQAITFAPTGAWTSWELYTLTAHLNPGATNTIRLDSMGQDLGNIDEMVIGFTPPVVTSVFVAGSAWTQPFRDFLESSGQGDSEFGYALTSAAHADELPWINLNQLSVRFSEDVTIAPGAFRLFGVNVSEYGGTIAYDPATFTATWTLSSGVFAADKLLVHLLAGGVTNADGQALDGEWTNPVETMPITAGGADTYPSGNGTAGGDFAMRLNALAGDVTRDGQIVGNDVTSVRGNQGFLPGQGGYTIFRDVTGDGRIVGNDVTGVRSRQGIRLPPGTPPTMVAARVSDASLALRFKAPLFASSTPIRKAMALLGRRFELLDDTIDPLRTIRPL